MRQRIEVADRFSVVIQPQKVHVATWFWGFSVAKIGHVMQGRAGVVRSGDDVPRQRRRHYPPRAHQATRCSSDSRDDRIGGATSRIGPTTPGLDPVEQLVKVGPADSRPIGLLFGFVDPLPVSQAQLRWIWLTVELSRRTRRAARARLASDSSQLQTRPQRRKISITSLKWLMPHARLPISTATARSGRWFWG